MRQATRVHDQALDVPHRRRLFEYVAEHPGSYLREVARCTMIPMGTTLYHMGRLESCGLLVSRRDGRYKRYFAGQALGVAAKDLVISLRHAVPRRIAVALLEVHVATQRELCARIGVSRSTLSFHAKQLTALDILRCEKARPENLYRLGDVGLTARLLDQYGASLGGVGPLRVAAPHEEPIALAGLVALPSAAPAGGG